MRRRADHEENLPAIEDAPQAHPWVSRAHEDPRRQSRDPGAEGERTRPVGRLTVLLAGARSASRRRTTTLRQRQEFEAVLGSPSKAIVSSLFIVRHLAKAAGPARLGIIASRKALSRAVDRNRAKRLIREAFRASHPELATMDLVVQVRSALARATASAARRDLAAIFGRITRG